MKFKEVIGIDISKKTLDAVLHCAQIHCQFTNDTKGFRNLVRWAEKGSSLKIGQMIICMEHTGIYTYQLSEYLTTKSIAFSIVSGLEIKRSLGITRGKNDKVDARKIAFYAYLRRAQLKLYQLPSRNISKLQKMLVIRDRMAKQKAGYQATLKEYKAIFIKKDNELLFSSLERMKKELDKQLKKLENEINKIIQSDTRMSQQYELMISIKGIGLIVAAYLLVTTNCFTRFENSRKYACYSGIAPFASQSGTSIKNKSRVSHYANKKMKSLLYLSASSAIQNDDELRNYYQKRIESGKSRMSTMNAVKNKIISRVFAVIKRGTPYVNINKYAA